MIITNKLNLPKQFEKIAQDFYVYKDRQFSATAILGSIRELLLKKRHNEEIEVDCSDLLYALFGQALHTMMEKYGENENEFTEEYLIEELPNGYKLSGRFDLFDAENKTLTDYKTCSVWSIIYKSDYEKWKKQLLIYAWLLKKAGFECDKGIIIAMTRDWSKSKAKYDPNYPQSQVSKIEFKFTDKDYEDIESFIFSRFKEIEYYETVSDEKLPLCTDEERFNSGNKYAIMKKGNKRAVKIFDSIEEANEMVTKDENYYIETRPGEDRKCLDYCNVCQFCDYYKTNYMKEGEK